MRSVFSFSFLALLAACGGSSSETPPPLEPDPSSYRYTGPRLPRDDEPAPDAAAEPEEADEDDLPRPKRAAASTWGSGKPSAQPSAAPASSVAPAPSASPAPAPAMPVTPLK